MAEFTRGIANVDDILASTLSAIGDELTEQWLTGFPLTNDLMKQENVKELDGGNDIVEPIEYQNASSVAFVNDTSVLDTSIRQIMSQMHVPWRILAGTIGILDSEQAKNMGRYQLQNLVESRVKNLKNSFIEKLEIALFAGSPGTDDIASLPEIVDSSDPSRGSYGDISRTTYTFWQANEVDGSTVGGFALAGIETVRSAELTVSKALTDRVTMHFTSQTLYASYMARLTQQEIFTASKDGDLEFDHLMFAGKPVMFSPQCTSTEWYGLNTNHMKFFINKNLKFKDMGWVRVPGGVSQSKVVETQCQLVAKRPRSNFKITGLAA